MLSTAGGGRQRRRSRGDLRTALLASTAAPLAGVLLCLALPAPAPLPRLDAEPAASIV